MPPRRPYQQIELEFMAAQHNGDTTGAAQCVTELAENLAEFCPVDQLQVIADRETGSLRCQASRAALRIIEEMKRSPDPRHQRPR